MVDFVIIVTYCCICLHKTMLWVLIIITSSQATQHVFMENLSSTFAVSFLHLNETAYISHFYEIDMCKHSVHETSSDRRTIPTEIPSVR